MLDKVLVAGAFLICGGNELVHDVPLVIAREDQALFFDLFTVPVLFFLDLQMDKAGEDLQQILG